MLSTDVRFFKEKYEKTFAAATKELPGFLGSLGVNQVEAGDLNNFCLSFARKVQGNNARVSSVLFAACVSAVLQARGEAYKVYVGFCLPPSAKGYSKVKTDYLTRKDANKPVICNHMYVETESGCHELYGGEFVEVDHIEVEAL